MASDDYDKLVKLSAAIEQLGYSAELLTKSEDLPVDMLSLHLENDAKDRPQYLTLAIYPLGDELDASNFVQFYFQYPFEIRAENRAQTLETLVGVNQALPLGHFNVSADANSIYFKYVLALAQNQEVEALFLNDVLDMCIYTQQHYMEKLEVFA